MSEMFMATVVRPAKYTHAPQIHMPHAPKAM
jgi:hypothetical protein